MAEDGNGGYPPGVKKKYRPGPMELDPDECALLVHYDAELVQEVDGARHVLERTPGVKKIKVRTLTESSNLPLLAQEIVDKCKLIHPTKLGAVESLLADLLRRETRQRQPGEASNQAPAQASAQAPASTITGTRPPPGPITRAPPPRGGANGPPPHAPTAPPPPHPRGVGDSAPPTAAADFRLDVEALAARRAEAERSADLRRSQAVQAERAAPRAHPADLDAYLELLYEESLEDKARGCALVAQLARHTDCLELLLGHETLLTGLARTLREDGRKSTDLCIHILSVFFALSNFSAFHPAVSRFQMGDAALKLVALETERADSRAAELASPGLPAEQRRRLVHGGRRAERLLYLCLHLLLNLAEDVTVEVKMKKRSIVPLLVRALERDSVDLLLLAVTFLKKLSIYRENKDAMAAAGVVARLARFVPCEQEALMHAALRLLLNLSFDAGVRQLMVAAGFVAKCLELMHLDRFQHLALSLLYHLSMDDGVKATLAYTGVVPVIRDMLLALPDLRAIPELIALAVNLTTAARAAEVMCDGGGLERLMARCLHGGDVLAFKVVRNLAQQPEPAMKMRLAPYVDDCISLLLLPAAAPDLKVEVLGTLANLGGVEYDAVWSRTVPARGLWAFLAAHLDSAEAEDDFILEAVIAVGTFLNASTAAGCAAAEVPTQLYHLIAEKKDDDDLVLHIAYAFQRLLLFPSTREALLRHPQVVYYLVDLLHDASKAVRSTADAALDVVLDCSVDLAVQVRRLKFEAFNRDWVAAVAADDPEQPVGAAALRGRRAREEMALDDDDGDGEEEEEDDDDLDHRAAMAHAAGSRPESEFDLRADEGGGYHGGNDYEDEDDGDDDGDYLRR